MEYLVRAARVTDIDRIVALGDDSVRIDRADVAACLDGGSQREDRAADHISLRLGNDDAGLWQVDQLTEKVRGAERALATGHPHRAVTQGDDTLDVGDTGCSD